MNIQTLHFELNKACALKNIPPISQEQFDILILTMTCKGMIKVFDDSKALTNYNRIVEKLSE